MKTWRLKLSLPKEGLNMTRLTAKEYAELKGKSEKMVRNHCGDGRIKGARFVGAGTRGIWMIPAKADYPTTRKVVRG
jgi:hypothetical protein